MRHLGNIALSYGGKTYTLKEATVEPIQFFGPAASHGQSWWPDIEIMPDIMEVHQPINPSDELEKMLAKPDTLCSIAFKAASPVNKIVGVLPGSFIILVKDRIFKRMSWGDAGLERPSDRAYNALRLQRKGQYIIYLTPLPVAEELRKAITQALYERMFGG